MSLLGTEGSSSDGFGAGGSVPPSPPQSTISGRVAVPRWASPWWLLFVALAVAEVVALGVREQRVPAEQDWSSAAAHVRDALRPTDAITVAPSWADPLLRLYLGDRITPKVAGRSDLAAFERLWVLTIRGARAPDAPSRAPDFEQSFGRVRLERYDLGPSTVLVDLADALPSARVERRIEGVDEMCSLRTFPPLVSPGGLGSGIIPPRQRFQCDFERHWLWVGLTFMEALDLSPRRCIWTHPQGTEPISIIYRDLPLGTRIVLYGGLDYHDERDENKAPVELRAVVNGTEVGRFVHHDGDGMARWEIDLRTKLGVQVPHKGELRIEVTTTNPFRRSFCWTGTVQNGRRKEAP